jgi:hypothetical protein
LPREDLIYQDFSPRNDTKKHVNVVQYLWADAFSQPESWIRARVVPDEVDYLDIEFENNGFYPSNIAIRPKHEQALKCPPDHPMPTFEVRSLPPPQGADGSPGDGKSRVLALCVRVVDAHYTHGEYGFIEGQPNLIKMPSNGTWRTVQVDLGGSTWAKFSPDGNHLNPSKKPDFSILSSLVLEFGGESSLRPGRGGGHIQVRRIRLEPR